MFGLGGFKILLTLAVIALVWFGFKYLGRLGEIKAEKAAGLHVHGRPRRASGRADREAASASTEVLEPCADCGTFVPKGQRACGRPSCPYS